MSNMDFIQADILSLSAFCVIAIALATLVVRSLKTNRFWLGIFLLNVTFAVAISSLGIAESFPIPTIPIFFVLTICSGVGLAFSKFGGELSESLPLKWLVGFQAFRLPLELVLHQWAELGTVPSTMTWTGNNWDIVAGITSLATFKFVESSRTTAWLSQITCLLLLLNVMRVVIMSSPFPFSWQLESPLKLAFFFPYALIVPLCVLPALGGHLLTIRKLLK